MRLLSCLLFVFFGALTQTAGGAPAATATSASSPPVAVTASNIRQEFERQTSGIARNTKNASGELESIIEKLLDEIGESGRAQELARLTNPASFNRASEFDSLEAQAFVIHLAKPGEVTGVQHFIAKNCPDYIRGCALEFYLATEFKSPETTAAVLTKAYAEAGQGPVAEQLFLCLERAFWNLRRPGQPREAFITAIDSWTKQLHAKLEINPDYPYVVSRPANRPTQIELFVLKPEEVATSK